MTEPRAASPAGRRAASPAGGVFLVAFSVLFLEMAGIRWLNASVQLLSYFNNVILISCFLGLGLGCLLARRRRLLAFSGPAFLALVLGATRLSHPGFSLTIDDDVIFARGAEYLPEGIAVSVPIAALFAFALSALFFTVLGQELARQVAAVGAPARAYAWDLFGSLLGTAAYAIFCRLGTPPWIWCAVGFAPLLYLLRREPRALAWNAAAALVAVFLVGQSGAGALWSPYYKVTTERYEHPELSDLGFKVRVNGQRIQDALRFGPELLRSSLAPWMSYYALPYWISSPRKVLILGAGSGNEAYIAASRGAVEIHAVEIDPALAGLGREAHPLRPYRNPAVRVVVDDARALLSRTEERYDLVVMSALDSHRHVPGLSIRLESFVYTVEAYRRIGELLAPGGLFCLNLSAQRPWMADRTFRSLSDAFGREPQMLTTPTSPFRSVAFVETQDGRRIPPATLAAFGIAEIRPDAAARTERAATDDWPFLYLEKNRVPLVNVATLGAVLLIALAAVGAIGVRPGPGHGHFFLLGAGFMLLDTRALTEAALLFGTTWEVNAIVSGGILAALWLANFAVLRGHAPGVVLSYALLFSSLAAAYAVPAASLLALGRPLRVLAAGALVGLPLAWASFIFSASFSRSSDPASALGANLLGVVLGGSLEYLSNVWGLKALVLVAGALYAGSWLLASKRPPQAVLARAAEGRASP